VKGKSECQRNLSARDFCSGRGSICRRGRQRKKKRGDGCTCLLHGMQGGAMPPHPSANDDQIIVEVPARRAGGNSQGPPDAGAAGTRVSACLRVLAEASGRAKAAEEEAEREGPETGALRGPRAERTAGVPVRVDDVAQRGHLAAVRDSWGRTYRRGVWREGERPQRVWGGGIASGSLACCLRSFAGGKYLPRNLSLVLARSGSLELS